jgi:hypothetical protein
MKYGAKSRKRQSSSSEVQEHLLRSQADVSHPKPSRLPDDDQLSELAPTLAAGPNSWGVYRDYYGWRMRLAFEAICRIPTPNAFMPWLQSHSPSLYRSLTIELPNQISNAWGNVTSQEFDVLCLKFVRTFEEAVYFYDLFIWAHGKPREQS